MANRPLYPINRDHLDALTGDLGIWQHATGTAPNRPFGYCTDDVARALVVDLLHARELGWDAVKASATRSLRFVLDAFDHDATRFRNMRDRDGSWEPEIATDDAQGRALLAVSAALGFAGDPAFAHDAADAFAAALPTARRLHALRAISSGLIACEVALDSHALGGALRADTVVTFEHLASRLSAAFGAVDCRSAWPWPEPVLTYENALLPRALIIAGRRLDDDGLRLAGRDVLDWLVRVQTSSDDCFSPIGSNAWWPRGGDRSQFDQQPIEATSMILALETAFSEFGEAKDLNGIERAYAWFLGDNDLGVPVAVPDRGGCHDGLTPVGVNLNQGAESTLMWLTALEHVRSVRRETADGPVRRRPDARATAVAGTRR